MEAPQNLLPRCNSQAVKSFLEEIKIISLGKYKYKCNANRILVLTHFITHLNDSLYFIHWKCLFHKIQFWVVTFTIIENREPWLIDQNLYMAFIILFIFKWPMVNKLYDVIPNISCSQKMIMESHISILLLEIYLFGFYWR